MPSFMRRFKQSQNLDIKDTPSLMHSPSTISSTSQSSASISLRRRMTTLASMLHFRRGRGRPSSKAISHISSVPWPRSPSRSPSPPSPDIRPPSGLGRRASIISELDMGCTDSPVSPTFPRMSEMFPSVPTHIVPPSARSSFQTHPTRARTLSSPAFLHSPTESAHTPPAPPPPPQRIIVTTPQAFEPRSPRLARQQARQSPPIPLSFVLAHIPRSRLPILARVSKRFSAAVQLALYRALELTADDADACVARLAGAPHLAALVTTLTLRAYPPAHGPSFVLALALALRSMRALSALTLPAFDTELLSAAPGTLTHLTLLADTLPYAFFDDFLAAPARARLTHLALPHFVGVPPAAHEVPPAAVPRLAVLDSSPGLAAALAPDRPLRSVTMRIASTLYDGLRPAALFGALGGALKELVLVLAPDVDVRTRGRLLGALGNTGAGLEILELSLDGTSDEVSLQALYKQVGSLLPNVQALRTLRLRASLPTETAKSDEEISVDFIEKRPTYDLELIFMDDAGVKYKSNTFKNDTRVWWNPKIHVRTFTSSTLSIQQRARLKIRATTISVNFKPDKFGDNNIVRLEGGDALFLVQPVSCSEASQIASVALP
ncbi:hypothetical protein H4582DRAFT_2082710 [Lactarius indigo]|nr:hypothetical protein H4582DRAFT_2082710 [Lactarius indigo]